MKVRMDYGKKGLVLDFKRVAKLFSMFEANPLKTPEQAIRNVILKPLSKLATPGKKVCIVISDNTRPVPNKIILPEILKVLKASGVAPKDVSILIGNGTHAALNKKDIIELIGKKTAKAYNVLNHDCFNAKSVVNVGTFKGAKLFINRIYSAADLKIVTGFIEPHFMAGFSGGRKGVCPGIAGYETIKTFHSAKYLASRHAVAGNLDNNPCDRLATAVCEKAGIDFLLNVTLNSEKKITGVFAGNWRRAHVRGAAFCLFHVKDTVKKPLDVVITSAGGYPLDRNFYQTVKGIVGAAEVVKKGGEIIIVSECADGLGGADFRKLLKGMVSPEAFIKKIFGRNYFHAEQWQVQELVKGLKRAKIKLFSGSLCEEDKKNCRVSNITDVQKEIDNVPAGKTIGVIPNGPYILAKIG